MSHLYNRSLLFAKSAAESNKKGVVGSNGKKAPNTPTPKLNNPKKDRILFMQQK